MIANALLMTIAVFLAYVFWLMDQLKFMAGYKAILFDAYATPILASAVVLFLNLFGACLVLQRKFLLKDTGRKLSHLDRQFRFRQIEMPLPDEGEAQDDAA
jgi:hypothetical protein